MDDFYIIYAEKKNGAIEELLRCKDRQMAKDIAGSHAMDPDVVKTYVCKHQTVTEFSA